MAIDAYPLLHNFENSPYSWYSASTGESRPARHAGNAPDISPASSAIPIASPISGHWIAVETKVAVCGRAARTRSTHHPSRTPAIPPPIPSVPGLKLDEQQHLPSFPSHRPQRANLARALEDAHHHRVRNPQDADQQGQGRCAPGRGLRQFHELVVAGTLRRGNRAKSRKRREGRIPCWPPPSPHAACSPTSTYSAQLDGFGIGKPSSPMPSR